MAAFEAEDDKFAENFHTVNFNKFFIEFQVSKIFLYEVLIRLFRTFAN